MEATNEMLDTILSIYSAPGGTAGWDDAITALNDLVGGKASVYLLVNKEDLSNEITAFCGFSEADRLAYEGPSGAAQGVRFQYLHNLVPGKVFREFEFVTDRAAWDASAWIQYQQEHLGCYWCMSAHVNTHGLWQDYISVNRLKELGPHTDQEKQNLQAMLPHLARAGELHRTLTSLERRYGAVLAVLDHLLVGLVLLDARARVVVANTAARAICGSSGAVRLTANGRLVATRTAQNDALQQLIDGAIHTAVCGGMEDGGQVPMGTAEHPVLAEVMPLRDDQLPDSDNIEGAAVFLMEPGLSQLANLDGIAKIFRLTPSESAVAEALVNGLTVAETAEQRGTSAETIRKQLKSVYAKTGAGSQLQLLRLAFKATPPITPG